MSKYIFKTLYSLYNIGYSAGAAEADFLKFRVIPYDTAVCTWCIILPVDWADRSNRFLFSKNTMYIMWRLVSYSRDDSFVLGQSREERLKATSKVDEERSLPTISSVLFFLGVDGCALRPLLSGRRPAALRQEILL